MFGLETLVLEFERLVRFQHLVLVRVKHFQVLKNDINGLTKVVGEIRTRFHVQAVCNITFI